METTTKLYWLTRVDSIHNLFCIFAFLALLVAAIAVIVYYVHYDLDEDVQNAAKKVFKPTLWFTLIFGIVAIFTPTRNELIFIYAGGKTIDFIQQDSSVNKLPSQATELVAKYLDNQIEQLNKESK